MMTTGMLLGVLSVRSTSPLARSTAATRPVEPARSSRRDSLRAKITRFDPTTRRALLIASSVVLFTLSFPPFELGALGFVALVPLHVAVRDARKGASASMFGVFGFITAFTVFGWATRFPGFGVHHAILCALYLSTFWAALGALWSRFVSHARAVLFLPAIAVGLEWIKGHAGFLALPWGTMGQTQHANTWLVQLASVGGEPLVGLVVVTANVALGQLLTTTKKSAARPVALVALAVVAALHLAGLALRPADRGEAMITVSAVQTSFAPERRGDDAVVVLDRLTRDAAASGAELVVWPESAGGDLEGNLLDVLRARAVVDGAKRPVLVGSSSLAATATGYNSLFLMTPGEPITSPYHKVHLVPFGETSPSPLLGALGAPKLETKAGEARTTMSLATGITVEPIICFESLFADDVRATRSSAPSVIALAVNDAWFGDSPVPARMHNLVSVFRAVENRRPVVIASNRGVSEIISASGRVVARARPLEATTITATVRADVPPGLYRSSGDYAPLAIVLMLFVASFFATLKGSICSSEIRGGSSRAALR